MVRADDDDDVTCYEGCPWCLVAADDDATQMMIAGLTTLSPPFAEEWNIFNISSTPRWYHGQMSPFRHVLAHLVRWYVTALVKQTQHAPALALHSYSSLDSPLAALSASCGLDMQGLE